MNPQWSALGGLRRTLARIVYARDSSTLGYVCPGRPGRPCGKPIDWHLPYRDPHTGRVNVWSKTIDHRRELQDGGSLADPDNLASVHLTCNSSKGAARRHARQRDVTRERVTIAVDPTCI